MIRTNDHLNRLKEIGIGRCGCVYRVRYSGHERTVLNGYIWHGR